MVDRKQYCSISNSRYRKTQPDTCVLLIGRQDLPKLLGQLEPSNMKIQKKYEDPEDLIVKTFGQLISPRTLILFGLIYAII